jgi:hypothetical protein
MFCLCVQVQDAILHNKRIFEQRMLLEDKGLMRKVLQGWRAKACASALKEARLRKAVARLMRSTMARAFYAWRDAYHLVDKTLAMKRKVRQGGDGVQRGRMAVGWVGGWMGWNGVQ